jgi:hypothetical protein
VVTGRIVRLGLHSRAVHLGRTRFGPTRLGGVRLGCLLLLVIVGGAMYYGAPLGDMYWKYYQFRDAFRQEVRFASQHTDDDIRRHLRALADTLQLPEEADTIFVKRKHNHILIWTEYYDHVDVPFVARDSFYFNPQAEGDF